MPIPNPSPLRAKFPALQQTDKQGRPFVFFDGPGGTQVPQAVIEALGESLVKANANLGGPFHTSRLATEWLAGGRAAMADFLNAPSDSEIVFGANMTSLTFALSRSIGRELRPGDEIIVTRLDHDANIAPWIALEERGAVIRWLDFDVEDCTLHLDQLESLLNERTRLVAVGYASNAVGTINPIQQIAGTVHRAGAWLYVDAVHYAPHGPIDVQALDCDFLVCSPYKFFGPHLGVLWGRHELLDRLQAYKVRPSSPVAPGKFETGTQSFEAIHATRAAIDYLAEAGRVYGADYASRFPGFSGRRLELKQAMAATAEYERPLFRRMLQGLQSLPGLTLYGIADPGRFDERCPTLAFTLRGRSPSEVAAALGREGIFVWDGNYYALAVTERLGVEDSGGMVRVGLVHYNTAAEVDRFLEVMEKLAA
ncbi:MAG: cysteine desulfurase-like protein [Anaerolineae bacterium]